MKNRLINLKSNKLIIDSFWALLGNVVFKGLSLVAGILVARILGKEIFGEFSIVKTSFLSLAFLTTFGFGYTATKFVADLKKNQPQKIRSIFLFTQKVVLFFTSVACVLIIIFAEYLATQILENKSLVFHIRLVSALVILNSLNFVYVGFLSGLGLFKKMAKVNALIGILTFFASVSFTYFYGLTGALLALLLAQLVNVIVNYILINKSFPDGNTIGDKKLNTDLLKYTLPIAIQEAVYAIMSWVINFLIIYYVSYGELGMYTAAIQLNAIILFIPGILRNVVLSHLSKNSDNNKEHNKVLKTILVINFLATAVPSLIIFLFYDFVASFYGNSFEGLGGLIKIAIFTTVFVSISNVYAQAYMSKNLNWTMLFFRIIRDGGIITLFIIMIKTNNRGAESMIYAQLILSAVFMVLMMLFYKFRFSQRQNGVFK